MKKPLVLGHRGASGYAPENTVISFRKAIELGCDGFELDVQLTKDNHLVVCHDEKINRTTDGVGYIKDLTLKEIKKLDAGKWFSNEFKNEKIPTLEEIFHLIKDTNLLINIEIKNGIIFYKDIEIKIINLLEKYKLEKNVIISSFNHYSIKEIKNINKNIKTGLLYMCGMIDPWIYAKRIGANAIHPLFYNINNDMVRECKKNNIEVNTFTVNHEPYISNILKTGVSGIITNFPDRVNYAINNLNKEI